MERLRCNACGQVFTAGAPDSAGPDKYDATAMAMIALLKYGTGLPFKRLEKLESQLANATAGGHTVGTAGSCRRVAPARAR
jgi:hypothetical protein